MKRLSLLLILILCMTCIPSKGNTDTEEQEIEQLLNEKNPYAGEQQKLTIIPQDEDVGGAYSDEYPSLPAEMRDFWAGVTPPASATDVEWFRNFFADVKQYTTPHFIISGATPYKEIPFEELSVRDAERSPRWYKGASAYLRLSPDYLRFYNEVIYPKMDAVLRVFAKERKEVRTQGNVNSTEWSEGFNPTRKTFWVRFDSGVSTDDYCLYYFHRVESPETLFQKKKVSRVTVCSTIYYLPKSFQSLFPQTSIFKKDQYNLTVHAHCCNEHDEHVISTSRNTDSLAWHWVTKIYAMELYFNSVYCSKDKETGDYTRCESTIITLKSKDELWPEKDTADILSEKIKENRGFPWANVIIFGICLIFAGLKIAQKIAGA